MTSRPLPTLLPLVLLTATASLAATAAQAQTLPAATAQGPTLPTLTATLTGSGTTNFKSGLVDFRNYTFNITGFSNAGPDPAGVYTIYSFSNSSLENSANFFGISPFNLPQDWTFNDSSDFVISTSPLRGIHATDPTFGLTIFQTAGTPAIDPTGAPFELFHEVNGVDPFLGPNGQPLTIPVNAVPEASSVVSFGLLLLGGLAWTARRKPRAA